MKAPSWALRRSPHSERTAGGQLVRGHDAGQDGVLPVVADVGDAVGPADHLALGRRRGGPRPAVVGDAVDRLGAQVEGGERDQRPPGRVVEPAGHVGVERVLAGVTARAVPAVVAERDGLGQGDVQPAGPGDGRGHLRHLERVGEAGALVVLGEDEDLGLAGQPAERGGVQDAVAVALEAGAPGVGLLGLGPVAGARRAGGPGREQRVLELLGAPAAPVGRRRGAGGAGGRPRVRARCGRASRRGPGGPGRSSRPSSLPSGHCAPSPPAVGGPLHVMQSARVAVTSRWPSEPSDRLARGVRPGGRAHRHHPHPQGARGGDA